MQAVPLDVWKQCQNIIAECQKNGLQTFLLKYYVDNYKDYLKNFFKTFWLAFLEEAKSVGVEPATHHVLIFKTIHILEERVQNWLANPLLNRLFTTKTEKKNFTNSLHKILYTSFSANVPLKFSYYLFNTFEFCFQIINDLYNKSLANSSLTIMLNSNIHLDSCTDFNSDGALCYCQSMQTGFFKFRNSLLKLGIFDQLCQDTIRRVIYNSIEKFIHKLSSGNLKIEICVF